MIGDEYVLFADGMHEQNIIKKKKFTEIAFLAAMFYFILTKAVLVC